MACGPPRRHKPRKVVHKPGTNLIAIVMLVVLLAPGFVLVGNVTFDLAGQIPSAYHEARNGNFGVSAIADAVTGAPWAVVRDRALLPVRLLWDPVLLTQKVLEASHRLVPFVLGWQNALKTGSVNTTVYVEARVSHLLKSLYTHLRASSSKSSSLPTLGGFLHWQIASSIHTHEAAAYTKVLWQGLKQGVVNHASLSTLVVSVCNRLVHNDSRTDNNEKFGFSGFLNGTSTVRHSPQYFGRLLEKIIAGYTSSAIDLNWTPFGQQDGNVVTVTKFAGVWSNQTALYASETRAPTAALQAWMPDATLSLLTGCVVLLFISVWLGNTVTALKKCNQRLELKANCLVELIIYLTHSMAQAAVADSTTQTEIYGMHGSGCQTEGSTSTEAAVQTATDVQDSGCQTAESNYTEAATQAAANVTESACQTDRSNCTEAATQTNREAEQLATTSGAPTHQSQSSQDNSSKDARKTEANKQSNNPQQAWERAIETLHAFVKQMGGEGYVAAKLHTRRVNPRSESLALTKVEEMMQKADVCQKEEDWEGCAMQVSNALMFAFMTSISGARLHAMFLARAAAHRGTGSGLLAFQDVIEAMKYDPSGTATVAVIDQLGEWGCFAEVQILFSSVRSFARFARQELHADAYKQAFVWQDQAEDFGRGRNFPYTHAFEQLQQGRFADAVRTTGQLLDSLESNAGPCWALHLKAYAHWWLGDLCEMIGCLAKLKKAPASWWDQHAPAYMTSPAPLIDSLIQRTGRLAFAWSQQDKLLAAGRVDDALAVLKAAVDPEIMSLGVRARHLYHQAKALSAKGTAKDRVDALTLLEYAEALSPALCIEVFKMQFVVLHQIGSCGAIADLWRELQRKFPDGSHMGWTVEQLQYFGNYARSDVSRGAFQATAYEGCPKCNYAHLLGVESNATPAECASRSRKMAYLCHSDRLPARLKSDLASVAGLEGFVFLPCLKAKAEDRLRMCYDTYTLVIDAGSKKI